MIRYAFSLVSLLSLLITQGCIPIEHHTATPYHKSPEQQQAREQPEQRGTGYHPPSHRDDSIVKGISRQAEQQVRNGELEAAAQTLERGLRIAPKDAFLWSQLATVRLKQHRYGQAQSLAAKSSSLARGNTALISRNRGIIEEAAK